MFYITVFDPILDFEASETAIFGIHLETKNFICYCITFRTAGNNEEI